MGSSIDEGTLSLVRAHMHSVRVPQQHDKVYKDECLFSFDTPESPGGLYINLNTFQGFGEDFLVIDYQRTRNGLYLHDKWTPAPLSPEEQAAAAEAAEAAKLATGAQGGLRLNLGGAPRLPLLKTQTLVVMGPEGIQARIPLPCPDLPERVLQAIAGVMAHESVSVTEAAAVWEEERRVSRYAADLPQLPLEGKRISPNPKDWRCEETGATDNLWLNLSTGFIGSGRQNWDGSGGNGSALRHYEATGRKYPLVVKLGTITPRGADVFSYAPDEDDMVLDPCLDKHLAHWGINMMNMEKSEKTMAELQMELNTSYEFSRITEAGGLLKPVHGPGFTGLINLGNSCYMNSVLQVLWLLPSMKKRYAAPASAIQLSAPSNPADDLAVQLSKVGVALLEGRTSKPGPSQDSMQIDTGNDASATDNKLQEPDPSSVAVRPSSFKSLVGRGHPEFSSGRQQDAVEFWVHLLEMVSRAEHTHAARLGVDPASHNLDTAPAKSAFTFQLQDRVQCMESGAVRYKGHEEQWLGLDIPLEAATNKEEVEAYREREARRAKLTAEDASAYISAAGSDMDSNGAGQAGGSSAVVVSRNEAETKVIPKVPFAACLAHWSGDEVVSDVWSAAAGKRCAATKHTRFATFPPYLMVALKRYYTSENWVPKKLEVEVDVPERVSLEHLRGRGLQPGEIPQPDEDEPAAGLQQASSQRPAQQPVADRQLVENLMSMGFSEPACTRAALAVSNAGVEQAMEWVLSHLEDPDINDPLPAPSAAEPAGAAAASQQQPAVNVEAVSSLTAMGFTDDQATAALKACSGSVERAADWLFSHMDDLDAAVAAQLAAGNAAGNAAPAAAAGNAAGSNRVLLDGPGEYELVGIISHMGANTGCGHYVAHVKKNGRWYIFNDEKVAESEHPPRDLGYLYMFQRVEAPA